MHRAFVIVCGCEDGIEFLANFFFSLIVAVNGGTQKGFSHDSVYRQFECRTIGQKFRMIVLRICKKKTLSIIVTNQHVSF